MNHIHFAMPDVLISSYIAHDSHTTLETVDDAFYIAFLRHIYPAANPQGLISEQQDIRTTLQNDILHIHFD